MSRLLTSFFVVGMKNQSCFFPFSFFFIIFATQIHEAVTMKKYVLDLTVAHSERLNEKYVLLKLTHQDPLPPMLPGQFVEVKVDGEPSTFLRRPVSINFVDAERNELWLLVAAIGPGTRRLAQLLEGERLNCVFPLGNGFTMPQKRLADGSKPNVLLVGGGVGVAPLLFFGKQLRENGLQPTFLLGARTGHDLLLLDQFERFGRVCVTTEDGSVGEKGFVTQHSVLFNEHFHQISTCGPKPMMVAVAHFAQKMGVFCEASLENMMACGLGACLCCVEKTVRGNVCVCKEGPVFDVTQLTW